MGYQPNAACAACKFQRRKCTAECSLAPWFPPNQPRRFASVHKLFGVSNVLKLFKATDCEKRNVLVKSIVYEAEAREKDPVHGAYGTLRHLERKEHELQCVRDNLRCIYEAMLVEEPKQGRHADQYVLQPSTSMVKSCISANMGGTGPPPRSFIGYSSNGKSIWDDLSAPRPSTQCFFSTQSQKADWMSPCTYSTNHVYTTNSQRFLPSSQEKFYGSRMLQLHNGSETLYSQQQFHRAPTLQLHSETSSLQQPFHYTVPMLQQHSNSETQEFDNVPKLTLHSRSESADAQGTTVTKNKSE